MKLLLDTHIWIWLLHSPERLGRRARHELGDQANELWVSPVSTWEALMLHRKKRVELSPVPDAQAVRRGGAGPVRG